jgi:hypothetical protein
VAVGIGWFDLVWELVDIDGHWVEIKGRNEGRRPGRIMGKGENGGEGEEGGILYIIILYPIIRLLYIY